jgi:hypothetical protein
METFSEFRKIMKKSLSENILECRSRILFKWSIAGRSLRFF